MGTAESVGFPHRVLWLPLQARLPHPITISDQDVSLIDQQVAALLSKSAISDDIGDGHLSTGLEHRTRLCVSPILHDNQIIGTSKTSTGDLVVVTPIWGSQVWFPVLMELSWDSPIRLPLFQDLLLDQSGNPHGLVTAGVLHLMAWQITGNNGKSHDFQSRLRSSSPRPGRTLQFDNINQHGHDVQRRLDAVGSDIVHVLIFFLDME